MNGQPDQGSALPSSSPSFPSPAISSESEAVLACLDRVRPDFERALLGWLNAVDETARADFGLALRRSLLPLAEAAAGGPTATFWHGAAGLPLCCPDCPDDDAAIRFSLARLGRHLRHAGRAAPPQELLRAMDELGLFDPPPEQAPENEASRQPGGAGPGRLSVTGSLLELFCRDAREELAALRDATATLIGDPQQDVPDAAARLARTLADSAATLGLVALARPASALAAALERRKEWAQRGDAEAAALAAAVAELGAAVSEIASRARAEERRDVEDALDALYREGGNDAGGDSALPEDSLDPQLVPLFLEEAAIHLGDIDSRLPGWLAHPQDEEGGQALARRLHTLKGSARMAGALRFGAIVHEHETALKQALAGDAAPQAVEAAQTRLSGMSDVLHAELALLDAAVTRLPAAGAPGGEPRRMVRVASLTYDRLQQQQVEIASDLAHALSSAQGMQHALDSLVRDLEREGASPFLRDAARLARASGAEVLALLQVQGELIDHHGHALEVAVQQAFATLEGRLSRTLGQAASDAGRRARLRLSGGATLADCRLFDRVVAPLEHLLRNAVAHGIEAPAERLAAGKDEEGEVAVEMALDESGDGYLLLIADDGAGLDLAFIRAAAERSGLIEPGEAVDDASLADFIFRPGFTTAAEASPLAGLGAGLDAAKAEIESCGGTLEVDSLTGRGTRFRARLPRRCH